MENEDKTLVMTNDSRQASASASNPGAPRCTCGGEFVMMPDRPGLRVCQQCGMVKTIDTFTFTPGMTLGNYRLLQRLGEGGMGMVFLCCPIDQPTRRLAMKVLRNDFSDSIEVAVKRFQREAEILIKMHHPVIIRTFEYWHDEVGFYSVMEFIDGKTLSQLKKQNYDFDEEIILEILAIVADAMLYVWENFRILHRDIKPSNIMITDDGAVKVLDFGIARPVLDSRTHAGLTMPGEGLGTPGYISPEQFRDANLMSCSSDIYGLEATAYFLFTGREPFRGANPGEVFFNMMHEEIVPAASLSPFPISEPMQMLLDMMLDKDPAKRIPGWRKLLLNIEKVKQHQMPVA